MSCSIEESLSQKRAYVYMSFKDLKLVIKKYNGKELDGRLLTVKISVENLIESPMNT